MEHEWKRARVRPRTTRIGAAASAGGAIAIVLLLALSPVGSGARSRSTFLAPYTGSSSNSGSYSTTQCGTYGGKTANWNEKTGAVTGESKSSATYCAYVNSFAEGYGADWVEVGLPFTVSSAGYYNATVDFNWKETNAISLYVSSCPSAVNQSKGYDYVYCDWSTSWFVGVTSFLYDVTNGSVVSQGYSTWEVANYSYYTGYNHCFRGSCGSSTYQYTGSSSQDSIYQVPGDYYAYFYEPTGTSSGVGSIWTNSTSWDARYGYGTNTTLTPSHTYELITEFYFGTNTAVGGYYYAYLSGAYQNGTFNPSGSAHAGVSGLPSNGLKVTSATVTKVV